MDGQTGDSRQTLSQSDDEIRSHYGQYAGAQIALVVRTAQKTEVIILEPNVPITVGRAPAAGIHLNDMKLSREHARFTWIDDRVHLEDLGSKNGTHIGTRRVQKAILDIGDEVVIGASSVRVQFLGDMGQPLALVGEERFYRRVEEQVSKAIELRRPFALLAVRVVDKHTELPPANGVRPWLESLQRSLRNIDRIGLHGADMVQVLLPETNFEIAEKTARLIADPQMSMDIAMLVGVVMHRGTSLGVDELIARAHQAVRCASVRRPVVIANEEAWSTAGDADDGELVAGASMREVLDVVQRVASSRLPIILLGETGTGKEVIARLIHELGSRKDQRMVRVNCGAIPKDLVESTLFGHERGAFTGAQQQQKGVFEEADRGTIFLDEIGELPLSAQAALLRVLETGCFCRVGSVREIEVNVRVVAATHRNLEAMAAEGTFRADLYYRLGGITIEIPSLSQRRDDIEPLARRFLRLANQNNGRHVSGIDAEAMELLRAYAWPGNVRELRNAIERAVVVARSAWICPDDLPARIRAAKPDLPPTPPMPAPPPEAMTDGTPSADERDAQPVRDHIQLVEARIVRDALMAAQWNRTEAAKQLGIPLRTLSYRMKVLGIKKPVS